MNKCDLVLRDGIFNMCFGVQRVTLRAKIREHKLVCIDLLLEDVTSD